MLKRNAKAYLDLGQRIGLASPVLFQDKTEEASHEDKHKENIRKEMIRTHLVEVADLCIDLSLETTADLLHTYAHEDNLPRTKREYQILIDAVRSGLKNVNFLIMPPHRAKYYEKGLPEKVALAFPMASEEIISAQKCYATGMSTACVFHSMRAVEIGVRTMGKEFGVTFPFPTELAEWHNILDQIDSKIVDMKSLPKGTHKDEDLRFYSEAATQFRYFKDGWRTRVAHTRGSYDEEKALVVLDHTISFFEKLADKLKE